MSSFVIKTVAIDIPIEKMQQFCGTRPIQCLALFGSVLRDDFHENSDVDMLVEFVPGTTITYFDLAKYEADLSEMLGRKVDLRTSKELSRYFVDDVIGSTVVMYERVTVWS